MTAQNPPTPAGTDPAPGGQVAAHAVEPVWPPPAPDAAVSVREVPAREVAVSGWRS